MHLFKSFIQDLDTSFIHSELILLGDFNVNFTGSNLNIDKAMKRKLILEVSCPILNLYSSPSFGLRTKSENHKKVVTDARGT